MPRDRISSSHGEAVHARRVERDEGRVQAGDGEDVRYAVEDILDQFAVHERRFGLLDEETVFFEGLEGVLIEIIREQSFTRADGVRAVDDDDVVIVFGFPHEAMPSPTLTVSLGFFSRMALEISGKYFLDNSMTWPSMSTMVTDSTSG